MPAPNFAHTERLKALIARIFWARVTDIGGGRVYLRANLDDVAAEITSALLTEADASPETPQSPDDVMDIYVPGAWKCLKCGFALSQATIFMGNGGQIGCTRDQVMKMTGERCPNDGAEMVRVTWHDRAIEEMKRCQRCRCLRDGWQINEAYFRCGCVDWKLSLCPSCTEKIERMIVEVITCSPLVESIPPQQETPQ